MATADELRTRIADGRAAFRAALVAAGDRYEQHPSGEGEDAWSPRQVAEHLIPVEGYYASQVCKACGYPGLDRVQGNFPTATDAVSAFDDISAKADGRLKYVTEKDLAMPHDRLGNVEAIIESNIKHLNDHAAQLRAI